MANTASRLSANGSLTISGYFDEVSGTYVTSGLIGSWDVNRSYYPEIDASTWYDMAGNNNIKIYNNNGTPALFSPSSNSANITFYTTNGSSQSLGSYGVVAIPQLATTANVTLEGVINIRQLSGMVGGFATYDIYMAGGNLGFNTAGGDVYGISAATVTSLNLLNRNVHYVFVFPTSNLPGAYQLWINGVQQSLSLVVGSATPTTRFYNNRGDYVFQLNGWYAGTPTNGAIPPSGTYYGNASWSSFRMYNRVLTSAEIQQNFNIASARYQLGSTVKPAVTAMISNNVTQNVIQAISGEFNEITYNPNSNVTINLMPYSQDFIQWNKASTTVTPNSTIAPDGKLTASTLTQSTAGSGWLDTINPLPLLKNKKYTFSVYAKAGTGTQFYILFYGIYFSNSTTNIAARFDLSAGTAFNESGSLIDSVGISSVGNGWYRCWMTATTARDYGFFGNQAIRTNYGATAGTFAYFWGYQAEEAPSPSIYVPTGANAIIANTFNQRTTNTGNTYVRGSYDEYSKMSPITDGLIFNIDPGYDGSYVGSGATIYDTTQNRYRIDLNNSPPYSSDFGGILKFTSTFGNNAWANTNIDPRIITTTSNYTMSAWVKFNRSIIGLSESNFYNLSTGTIVSPQANTGYSYGSLGTILGNNFYGDYGLYWLARINNNGAKELSVGLQNRVNSPLAFASPSQTVFLNDSTTYFNWTHIVGVYNSSGNFAGFYVNGVLVNSTTTPTTAGSFPYNSTIPTLRIAASNEIGGSGQGRNFDGDIGPMSIWNRALSASEIQQMYSSQRSRFGI
jgi:hypothetical protein